MKLIEKFPSLCPKKDCEKCKKLEKKKIEIIEPKPITIKVIELIKKPSNSFEPRC